METYDASTSGTSHRAENVGAYLIERLRLLGLSHIFGVPGDYVLGFFKQLSDSALNLVTTCDELNAGYAAAKIEFFQPGRDRHVWLQVVTPDLCLARDLDNTCERT